MAQQILKYRITGTAPLILHSGRLADPLYAGTKAIKEVSTRRKKTDADFEELSRLEFLYSFYLKDGVPYIPADNLSALILEGAKKSKEGKLAAAGAFACDGKLIYKGSPKPEKLFESEEFRLTVGCKIQRNRVMRTRPIFREWAVEFEVMVDDQILNPESVTSWLISAGSLIGLGDWRPRYGRFAVERLT